MSPSWEEDSPRGKGPARHTFQVHPTWDGWAEGTGGNDFLAENRHFRSECLSKVERERRIKTKEPKLGFSLSSPNLDFIYLLGAHAQIGRILSGSSLVPFPVLLSIPMFESGWQISEEPGLLPARVADRSLKNLVCFLLQMKFLELSVLSLNSVIWSSLTAWNCYFLDKINHSKLALTSKLEPSRVFFLLFSPFWSLNVL
jgi:hypothetical protein